MPRCPKCLSKQAIRWGKTSNSKTRWYCKICQRVFVWKKKKHNHKQWLSLWINGLTINQIAKYARKSRETIKREINHFLSNPPVIKPVCNSKAHLLIDATHFKRKSVLIVYYDNGLKYIQRIRYADSERVRDIVRDLKCLKRQGINIKSITTDGHSSVKSATRTVFPYAKQQRCLVHIQRFANTYLTKHPKTQAGLELKEIVSFINYIDNQISKRTFLGRISEWHRKYNDFLKERTYSENNISKQRWWYTHRNLRKVIYHINSAIPDMFHYIDNKAIPKDTNGLEGRFNDLKHKFRTHRGLKETKRKNYLYWYLNTKNKNRKYSKNIQIPTKNDH